MSSPPTPPRDPDELASALLDGELPPAEASAAADDPDVRRRLAVLRATRDALRAADPGATGEPPRPQQRAAAIGRALAAFDAEGHAGAARPAADGSPGGSEAVTGPGVVGALRRAGGAHPVRWFSAAAAVLVLAGMVALISLASGPDTGDDATVAQGPDREEAEDPPAAGAPGAEGRAGADATDRGDESSAEVHGEAAEDLAAAPAAPVDLGTPASTEVLVARATAAVDEAGRLPPATERAPSTARGSLDDQLDRAACDTASARGPLTGTRPLLQMTAVMDGERLGIWAYAAGPDLRIVALDESCRVVVDRIVHG